MIAEKKLFHPMILFLQLQLKNMRLFMLYFLKKNIHQTKHTCVD